LRGQTSSRSLDAPGPQWPEWRTASLGGPRRNPWPVAIAVMISAAMEVLDTTVVNVSLPHIAGSLSASVDEAT